MSVESLELDNSVLAMLITVLAIRGGGRLVITEEEWHEAGMHDGSLLVTRQPGEDVQVILLRKTVMDG